MVSPGRGANTTYGNSQTALFGEFFADESGYAAYKMLAHILMDMTSVERGAGNSFTIHREGKPPLVVAWLEDGQSWGMISLPGDVRGSVMTITDPVTGSYEVQPLANLTWVFLTRWPQIIGELP